jgi:hypothetical protein
MEKIIFSHAAEETSIQGDTSFVSDKEAGELFGTDEGEGEGRTD